MKLPGGYSNSNSSSRVKPSFRQMAFDGAFCTAGKACRNRSRFSDPAQDDGLGGCPAGNTSALEGRKHGPSDLVDLLVAPGPLPVPDPPDRLGRRFVDDLV